jgi:hypothetical protein
MLGTLVLVVLAQNEMTFGGVKSTHRTGDQFIHNWHVPFIGFVGIVGVGGIEGIGIGARAFGVRAPEGVFFKEALFQSVLKSLAPGFLSRLVFFPKHKEKNHQKQNKEFHGVRSGDHG